MSHGLKLGLGLGLSHSHRPPQSGGGGEYIANAVSTDGSFGLVNEALASTDNEFFSMAFWFKIASIESYGELFVTDPLGDFTNSFDLSPGEFSYMQPHLKTELGDEEYATLGPDGQNISMSGLFGAWHHFLCAAKTNAAAGSKILKIYIDDVDTGVGIQDADPSFNVAFNGLPLYIFDDTYGEPFIGEIADLWIAPGVSLLDGGTDIAEAKRRLFISAGGKPVDPIGFPSAPCLFSGDASTFGTNRGTGGAFTISGSLTNAATSPSD